MDSYDGIQSMKVENQTFAPEIMAGIAHGPASDVWGLGRIATQLLALINCPDDHPLQITAQSMM